MEPKIINEWFDNLVTRNGEIWEKTISVTGTCRRHIGPRTLFATVTLDFSPAEQFEINNTLNPKIAKYVEEQGWYEYIIFGVLDIMLTTPTTPIRNFKITIRAVDFNEIETSQIAFRLSARNAASKALAIHFPT